MLLSPMRYLSSISLALIVHVLLSIVVLMMLACTAEPADSGPRYSEEEAIAVLKEHLQTKIYQGRGRQNPCLMVIEDSIRNPDSVSWSANYNNENHRWDVTVFGKTAKKEGLIRYTWTVYERTKSIVATGDEPINQYC